ncbi:uncharacterized protein LOC129314232 [Prosopis cineraria]|uniref:uncharacterized protein LOC129314232 n=1 Tax=Prosopis cineraria TaxID=364024 RepID=UPI00240F31AE|nr:uncharacterized protein LOC129314232 [Prosopis cineraria]XP_054813582.1 uncharacterized protein LOC129314232 [Prosopis cineraria]XP_054813591.1 uncharacterized protein LOC129314232 [Prosopis cineraria]XP_054813599.1 uncharacterized protein LOC129314232 [Prosopis cineraria]XP_054813606.1 uncharacterized protein LOC129314232 [Prosopis cineraria]XP_054813614.1 uncharacterized protein LOC129314232 [Prosopis cineraria]
MEKKRKIVEYRERLDKTLSSPDLTNEEALKALVERQLHSLGQEIEGYEHQEKAVETRAAEVSKFLDMLRSVSADGSGRSKTLQTDWKLKQDNEEFRVMYREGPEGTPFHTLLAEGYVDGPVDVCLCMSWETPLYKKWWPQFTVPTFKILVSDCLQRARIGEQLSLVRVKLSWPLSTREAVMHYYLFEYFQDDLIVVIINTIPDSKSFDGLLYGFNNEAIPEATDVVRIDVVGGFALQKVTSERSYFRTIANMDIKLDIVPPSLINFISRQLIGSGFRLYQKSVASMMDHDEAFIKALEEPLYSRLREALYVIDGSRKAVDAGELKQGVNILPAEDVTESKQDETKDVPWEEDKGNYQADDSTSVNEVALDNGNAYGEIVEADGEETEHTEEDDGKVKYFPIKEDNMSQLKGKRNVHIRAEVEQALETLEKAISVVREYGFHSNQPSPSFNFTCEKDDKVYIYSRELGQFCSKKEVSTVKVLDKEILEENSQEALRNNPDIHSLRRTGTNSNLKEVNYNKVVPASPEPEQNVSFPICYSENGATEIPTLNQNTLDSGKQSDAVTIQDTSSDQPKKSSRLKKHQYCCFLPSSSGKLRWLRAEDKKIG